MYTQIQNRLRLQHLLNYSMFFAQYVGVVLGVGILLCHRLLMVDGTWLWSVLALVPVLTVAQIQKNPILKRHVLAYAERQSGGSGFLWFEEEVGTQAASWSNAVSEKWKMVELPPIRLPSEVKRVSLLLSCCIALMWVPIRNAESSRLPAVVQQEFELVQEEVSTMDALVEAPDPQIEAWKETLADIEDGMSVGNTLRTLDDLSQQIEQRREEAMEAVSEAMDALEQGDTEELSKSIESLRKQNMLPSSAQDKESTEGQANNSSESTGEKNTNNDGEEADASKKEMTQQQQQLSQQLQQLQSQLQQMQSSSSSSSSSSPGQGSGSNSEGLQSYSNEDLQKMSEMGQGQDQGKDQGKGQMQSGSSSNGNQGPPGQGQQSSQSGSQSGNAQGSDQGAEGGGASALTYGPETDLIPNSNLRALDGIPQVDWGNSVQFGTAPGQAGEVKTVPVSTDGTVQSAAPMTGQQQVAPQHRTAVKEFFAVERTEATNE